MSSLQGLRDRLQDFLRLAGPQYFADIERTFREPVGELYRALSHWWFEVRDAKWRLSQAGEGRQSPPEEMS
jgi:hypothetical protein